MADAPTGKQVRNPLDGRPQTKLVEPPGEDEQEMLRLSGEVLLVRLSACGRLYAMCLEVATRVVLVAALIYIPCFLVTDLSARGRIAEIAKNVALSGLGVIVACVIFSRLSWLTVTDKRIVFKPFLLPTSEADFVTPPGVKVDWKGIKKHPTITILSPGGRIEFRPLRDGERVFRLLHALSAGWRPERPEEEPPESYSAAVGRGKMTLDLQPPPKYERQVLSYDPTPEIVARAVRSQRWDDLTYLVLRKDEENWLSVSGYLPDHFAAFVQVGGKETAIDKAPQSMEEMTALLQSYLADDKAWKSAMEAPKDGN